MSRAVTADHVLFNECISAFRPNGKQHLRFGDGPSCSYLLTSFHLTEKWQLPNCTIYPSVRVHLPGANSAFICKVQNPDWCDTHNSHLYGVALSSIVTFASGRPCKSTRDDYLCRGENLTESDALQISLVHPILTAGPGCMHTSLAAITLQKYQEELADLITSLHELPYSIYVILMQAIRLVHLSLLTKRDDFGLAYLLVISAIESVAQCAIKRKDVKQNHPNEAAWSKRAQEDQDFSNLLSAYKDARGKNQYLSERYPESVTSWLK